MKVSIITTCYNRAKTVARSVRSVMKQTYPDIEHIIIDGKSMDGSVEAIKECNSTRISYLVSEKDKGCYDALNKGLAVATGDIVGWLHSDDIYFNKNIIAEIVDIFTKTGCDMVYADGLFVSPENPDWIIRDWKSGNYSDRKIEFGWLPLHTTVFVRREVIEKLGGYNDEYKISGDTFWLLKVMYKTGLKIYYWHQHTVIMNYGGLSTNMKMTFLRWREDLGVYKRNGLAPRRALIGKILRKVPQFVKGPFSNIKHRLQATGNKLPDSL